MSVTHFRKLEVWELSMKLVRDVYQLSEEFPVKHRYGLTSQLQRSATSIPSNIAEGNGRGSTRDYARFVSIALGSTAELETQLLLARELGLADPASIDGLLKVCDRVGQMLQRLNQALRRRIEGESRVPSPESR